MHIFFSGIGGSGIGPLARLAKQAGYEVSGSDKQESAATKQLQKEGINLHIGQTEEAIAKLHKKHPIDWFVFSSAVTRENLYHPELIFAKRNHIKHSMRDELLNQIITDKKLRLIGIAGTHGKSTTTAMIVWLFYCLKIGVGHSVGAKLPFAQAGELPQGATYFVYECDEFDYNFLAFHPYLAAITGIGWDHHEIFPTKESYVKAYRDFIAQSRHTFLWQADAKQLKLATGDGISELRQDDPLIDTIALPGEFNRHDALLAVQTVHAITQKPVAQLIDFVNEFPGLKQRMELLRPNLYTNYAHTPEKIKGGLNTALELADNQDVIVIYEPLTNRRQHHIKHTYKDTFKGAKKVHWVRTYLAREDPNLQLLTPAELITYLDDPNIAAPAEVDVSLLKTIKQHLADGDIVVAMGASGTGSLDEWLRTQVETGKL